MPQQYDKGHLSLDEQLALMKSRRLGCTDDAHALAVLRAAGYYRFSAYVYPFREFLPEEQRAHQRQFRDDVLRPGATFEQIEALWRFDREFRLAWLDGLETVEVGIRTQLAYVLGRRDPYGHLDRTALEESACSRLITGKDGGQLPAFQVWSAKYADLVKQAENEDFVVHHVSKYGEQIPIWKAVEFLDFGALTRLFGLLRKSDKSTIAEAVGIPTGDMLHKFLVPLNHIRNVVAHHSRLWNRRLTYRIKQFPAESLPDTLAHISLLCDRKKVYIPLAVSAYLTRRIDPPTQWTTTMRSVINNFPALSGVNPSMDMGFPQGWGDLALWESSH